MGIDTKGPNALCEQKQNRTEYAHTNRTHARHENGLWYRKADRRWWKVCLFSRTSEQPLNLPLTTIFLSRSRSRSRYIYFTTTNRVTVSASSCGVSRVCHVCNLSFCLHSDTVTGMRPTVVRHCLPLYMPRLVFLAMAFGFATSYSERRFSNLKNRTSTWLKLCAWLTESVKALKNVKISGMHLTVEQLNQACGAQQGSMVTSTET